jgi:murein DD-endopeptidase MepM/ murein hydrolase activator NlpD
MPVAVMSRIMKMISALVGGNILLLLIIPLLFVLIIAGIVGSVIGAILRFFGIIPDIPSVPDDIEEQILNAPGMTALNLPLPYVATYRLAETQTNVPWTLLAAMHKATTDCGRNMHEEETITSGSSEKRKPNPIGQFHFKQTFWAGEKWKHDKYGRITTTNFDLTNVAKIQEGSGWGKDIDEDKKADPENADDAIISLAFFLQSKGAKKGATDQDLIQAVTAFQDDEVFVQQVMTYYYQLLADPLLQEKAKPDDIFPAPASDTPEGFTATKGPLQWPSSSREITKPYGYHNGTYNPGIDFTSPSLQGVPAVASANGKVLFVGSKQGYNQAVVIDVGHGITLIYSNLQSVSVKTNDITQAGGQVGIIGSNGIHFEVRLHNAPVDPIPYLEQGLQPIIKPPSNKTTPIEDSS